jgi:hypothetical protein
MADEADVRSIDVVRTWHAALADYGDTLREALAGIELELHRAQDWLDEQLSRWQRAIRDYEDDVVRAKAELSQRKFPNWDGRVPDCTVQEKNLRDARARLEHAQDQVVACRQWLSRLPKLIDETYTGSGRRLANFLEINLPRALADLTRRIRALESYAGDRPDYAPAPSVSAVAPANTPTPVAPSAPKPEQPT